MCLPRHMASAARPHGGEHAGVLCLVQRFGGLALHMATSLAHAAKQDLEKARAREEALVSPQVLRLL
jgi:hypothetical protein